VTPLSLAVASGSPVLDRARWFEDHGEVAHVAWAAWADALVVAPATVESLASAAHGHAGDVVSALIAAGARRVLWAPAMNPEMWRHPPVRDNVRRLAELGHAFVGPVWGSLAGADEGVGEGRMADVDAIVAASEGLPYDHDLRGLRVLVSAGPTREHLDPVRFLSNPSSGRQGYAVAQAALARGASVALVSGPTREPDPPGADITRVESAAEMLEALAERFDACDVLIMTAAVADWRPERRLERKEPKSGESRSLPLVRTADILRTLAPRRVAQVIVGFAMETHEGVERAAAKARDKGCDWMVLNYPAAGGGAGFGAERAVVTLVGADGAAEPLPPISKRALAHELLTRAAGLAALRR
jgi:phosphopantothenoylcysteine decarboxylase/phosphopantothenate--cysteine ligase